MNVTFYSFSKRQNSTARPTGGTVIDCAMRSGFSPLKPKLEVRGNPTEYNYMKIDTNYYYITDCIFNAEENFFIVEGERDPLATFRTQIFNSSQAILRTSDTSNQAEYLADSLAIPIAQPYRISSAFGDDLFGGAFTDVRDNHTVIVAVAGKGFVCTQMAQYENLIRAMFYTQAPQDEIAKWVVNPASWFIGQMAFPLEIAYILEGTASGVQVAWWNIPDVSVWHPKTMLNFTTTVQVPFHPDSGANPDHYLNQPPYVSYSIYAAGFGQIAVDSNKLRAGESLTVKLDIDLMSGGAKIKFTNTFGQVVAFSSAQMGYDVAYASRNPPNVLGAVSAPLIGGAVGGALGVVGGAMSAISQLAGSQGAITTGSTGGAGGWNDYTSSRLEATYKRVSKYANARVGRPSDRTLTLSSQEGFYVECLTGSVNCKATPAEKNLIENTLKGGVYLG